jgi:hypothetical protein
LSSYFQFQYQIVPEELRRLKRSKKEVYEENVNEHMNTINIIAKGDAPQIYKVIKECLKEKLG